MEHVDRVPQLCVEGRSHKVRAFVGEEATQLRRR